MELSQLKAFLSVSQTGGFAPAAAALDLAPSSITRAIANLESSLGVRLFQRSTRRVTLTEAGEQFLQRVVPALEELDAAVESLDAGSGKVTGHLRVAASVSFGQMVLAPRLKQFTERFPGTRLELILSDGVTDIIGERIDVAVRHGKLNDSALIARRLRRVEYRLVASPSYLQRAAKLAHPRDIANHRCITFPYHAFRSSWMFARRGKTHRVDFEPVARISNAAALAACAKSGMGLSLLADWLVDPDIRDGLLKHVLPNWRATGVEVSPDSGLWVVMPTRQFLPAKTQAFTEFLMDNLGA